MRSGVIGQITTPLARNAVEPRAIWCADNAAFGDRYPGDHAYLKWLAYISSAVSRCRFAPAPDVVGDAARTLERSAPMLSRIRSAGYPAALVAQDGLEHLTVPWADFDALFIGGTTAWKVGPAAADLSYEANRRGKWVHMGRVNSLRRLLYAKTIGCKSVDGTFLRFGPDVNVPRLLSWLDAMESRLPLFELIDLFGSTPSSVVPESNPLKETK